MIPKINSAHGSETRNIINRAIEVLNVQGKTIQDLVAEGQLTPSQYAELITLINGLVKSGNVDKSDLTSEFKDEIEGFSAQLAHAATKEEVFLKRYGININDFDESTRQAFLETQDIDVNYVLGAENVSPFNTTFFKRGTNLFNKETIVVDKSINPTTGEPVENLTTVLSAFIPVKANQNYRLSYSGSMRFGFYDGNYAFISSVTTNPSKTPLNASFIRFSLPNTANIETLRLNEGVDVLPYESYQEFFDLRYINNKSIEGEKLKDNSLGFDKISFVKKSPNLADSSKAIKGYSVDTTGKIVENTEAYVFDFINVKANTQYIKNAGSLRVAFYDVNGVFMSSTTDQTFTTPLNTAFLRMAVPRETFESYLMQLNEGTSLLNEEFYEYIDPKYIENTKDKEQEKKFWFVPEIPSYEYEANTLPSADGTGDFDHHTSVSSDVYAKYDELIANHSDYITKTLQGNDESGTLPIYKLELNPERANIENMSIKTLPTIFISCGIHGDGSGGYGDGSPGDPNTHVFSLYYFIKELCENWQSNKTLEYLRWNVNFVILPLSNPWGFDNKSRYNSNGVDINRNFDSGWKTGTTHGSQPFSEKETQYIRDAFYDSENVFASVDYHMIGGLEYIGDAHLMRYFLYDDEASKQICEQTIRQVSRQWQGKYGLSTRNFYGRAETVATTQSCAGWMVTKNNISSATLEGFLATDSHREKSGSIAMTMNLENLVNYIMNAVRYFYNKD